MIQENTKGFQKYMEGLVRKYKVHSIRITNKSLDGLDIALDIRYISNKKGEVIRQRIKLNDTYKNIVSEVTAKREKVIYDRTYTTLEDMIGGATHTYIDKLVKQHESGFDILLQLVNSLYGSTYRLKETPIKLEITVPTKKVLIHKDRYGYYATGLTVQRKIRIKTYEDMKIYLGGVVIAL